MWKVGNGLKINLWEDKWIPSTFSHKIQDPIRVLSKDAKVANIIDLDSNWWNVPLVEHIFSPETVERICSIPISPRTQEDKLVWAGTKTGAFAVHSAYHLEIARRTREMGSVSTRSVLSPYWRRLWKSRVPRLIIMFLCRASNGILPTKNNLFKRKVVADPLCPMCGCDSETSGHILWSCDAARTVWGLCEGPIHKSSILVDNFFSIFCYLCNHLNDNDLELFTMLAHKIWIPRNRLVFDGLVQPPHCLLKGAIEELEEFQKTLGDVVTLLNGGGISSSQWSTPAVGNIKINWDAALDGRKKLMGVGIVARDSVGRVVATMCAFLPYIRDLTMAKAIGAWRAVEFRREMDFNSIELEGDAREVVLALESPEVSISMETRLLFESYQFCSISHIRSESNMVAHCLAKFVVAHKCHHVWIDVCPYFISEVVCVEHVF